MRRFGLLAVVAVIAAIVAGSIGHAQGARAVLASGPSGNENSTVTYSGTLDSTVQLVDDNNQVNETLTQDVTWKATWTGPTSMISSSSGETLAWTSVTLSGSDSIRYRDTGSPDQPQNCADSLSAAPGQTFNAILPFGADSITFALNVPQPSKTATAGGGCFMSPRLACPPGRPPNESGATSYCSPAPAWTFKDGAKTFDISSNYGPTNVGGKVITSDLTSTVSVSGDSCTLSASSDRVVAHAAAGPGTSCKPFVDWIEWGGGSVPVVVDRSDGSSASVTEVPGGYGSCSPPNTADWVRCNPSGPPGKNWPVMVQRRNRLTIKELNIECPATCDVRNGTLLGRATLAHRGKLLFKRTGVSLDRGAVNLKGVVSEEPLPNHAAVQPVSIHWTITRKGKPTIDAGVTTHVVYETLGKPPTELDLRFKGQNARFKDPPYLSVVALASKGADGATNQKAALSGMWKLFDRPDRAGLHRFDLNSDWDVVEGSPLRFWYPDWSPLAQLSGSYLPRRVTCPTSLEGLLAAPHVASCNGIEQLFVAMLRVEGINATGGPPNDIPNPTGGNRTGGWGSIVLPDAAVFLVGDWKWFTPDRSGLAPKAFPYVDQFNFGPTGVSLVHENAHFVSAAGQNNSSPVSMWATRTLGSAGLNGDHDLVTVDGKVYDPSYGKGPFDDLSDWASHSIVGWAFFEVFTAPGQSKHVDVTQCAKFNACYMVVHKVSP